MHNDDQVKGGNGDGDGAGAPRKIDDVSFSSYKYDDIVTSNKADLKLVDDGGGTVEDIPNLAPSSALHTVAHVHVSGVHVVVKDRRGNVLHREFCRTSAAGMYFTDFHVLVDRNVEVGGNEVSP